MNKTFQELEVGDAVTYIHANRMKRRTEFVPVQDVVTARTENTVTVGTGANKRQFNRKQAGHAELTGVAK